MTRNGKRLAYVLYNNGPVKTHANQLIYIYTEIYLRFPLFPPCIYMYVFGWQKMCCFFFIEITMTRAHMTRAHVPSSTYRNLYAVLEYSDDTNVSNP